MTNVESICKVIEQNGDSILNTSNPLKIIALERTRDQLINSLNIALQAEQKEVNPEVQQ